MLDELNRISKLLFVFTAMTLIGSLAMILRIVSLDYLVDFNRKYFIASSSRIIMRIIGIKLDVPKWDPGRNGNYFITFNHNSYLDGFALTAMGFTRTHILLSEKMIKLIPATLMSLGIGVLFIPQKKHHDRRMRFFERVERRIVKTNVSIAGSSEGVHEHNHGIAPFNKGVYHMAMVCKMKIIPLFISIPAESNPFDKYTNIKKGTVRIEIMDTIDTTGWTLENLEANKEKVRDMYVRKFNAVHRTAVA